MIDARINGPLQVTLIAYYGLLMMFDLMTLI